MIDRRQFNRWLTIAMLGAFTMPSTILNGTDSGKAGTKLADNIVAALNAAYNPSGANRFITSKETHQVEINLSGAPITQHADPGYEAALILKGDNVNTMDARALEIYLNPGIGNPIWDVGAYFLANGAFYTDASIVVSGHPFINGVGHVEFSLPNAIVPAMISSWGDVAGPSIALRPPDTTSNGTDSIGYNLQAYSGKDGKFVFAIEDFGGLRWGLANDYASMDTNLYRSAANTLKTDDAFVVGDRLGIGGNPLASIQLTITDASTPYMAFQRGADHILSIYHDGSNASILCRAGGISIQANTNAAGASISCGVGGDILLDVYGQSRKFFQGTDVGGATTIGFHSATPIAKPTINGSRGGNAALAALLTQLVNYGLIVDGTSE